MGRNPPKLLSRVIRAIASLHEQKGSSVPSIVTQVRYELSDSQNIPRNVTMLVRSALKHAVENGLLMQRAGKYRMVGRKRVIPIDSLEMAVDCKRKKTSCKKKKKLCPRCPCKKRKSDHDASNRRASKSQNRRGRRRKPSSKSAKEMKSETVSNAGSEKCVSQPKEQPAQQQRSNTPNDNANLKESAKSNSRSQSPSPDRNTDVAGEQRQLRRETPFPDSTSESSAPVTGPSGQKKRGRPPRNRAPHQPPNRNPPPDCPPAIGDEPMDVSSPRMRSIPRNISPRRQSVPRQHETPKENDSLDDIHDRPPSYYD